MCLLIMNFINIIGSWVLSLTPPKWMDDFNDSLIKFFYSNIFPPSSSYPLLTCATCC